MGDAKKKTKSAIGIVIIIAVIVGIVAGVLIGFGVKKYRDYIAEEKFKSQQEELLQEELEKVIALDPLVDEVDQTIYTEKDFAKVEKAIKAYFTDFFSIAKTVNGFPSDERFAILNSQDAMLSDAPEFSKTLSAIDTLKSEYVADVDAFAALLSNEKIESYLESGLDQEYVDLYKKLMTDGATVAAESELEEQMTTTKERVVTVLDKYKTMLEYLVSIQDTWEVEGSTLMFTDQDNLDQYNKYVKDLNTAIDSLGGKSSAN